MIPAPEVSVIIPVFNPGNYINQICESLANQTFKNYEIIAVDDDHSKEFCDLKMRLEALSVDLKLRVVFLKTAFRSSGPAAARNLGLDLASAPKITFFDCDDYWHPYYLERMSIEIDKLSADIIVCNSITKINGKSFQLKLPRKYGRRRLLQTNILSMPCVMIKSNKFKGKRFPNCGHEDYAFWLANVTDETSIEILDEALVTINKVENSVSSNFLRSISWYWKLLNVQKISPPYKCLCFCLYLLNAINKRKFFFNRIVVF